MTKCTSYNLVWPLKYHHQLYGWKLQSRPQKAHGQTDSHHQTQHETNCRAHKKYCIFTSKNSKNFHLLNKPNLVLNTFPNLIFSLTLQHLFASPIWCKNLNPNACDCRSIPQSNRHDHFFALSYYDTAAKVRAFPPPPPPSLLIFGVSS